MIIPGHSKNLKITISLIILFILGTLVTLAPRRAQGPEPQPITQAVQYFIEKMQERVIFEKGFPKDGFSQEMFLSVYPNLIQEDFRNVEVVVSEGNPESSYINSTITSQGMAVLLYNISLRTGLPMDTIEDIDGVMNFILSGSMSGYMRVNIKGEYICLPKKDIDGPVTLECALGIKSDEGKFYALDLNVLQTSIGVLETGSLIQVEGNLVPLEQISSANWHIYDIEGIIWVTTLNKLN